MDDATKMGGINPVISEGVPFGVEHAKDNPAPTKEFWQTGQEFLRIIH